jgi:hypothetical protein
VCRGPRRTRCGAGDRASAAFAGVESIHKLLSDQGTSHVGAGIAAAAAGIIGNQWQMNTVTTKPATGSAQGLPEGDADEPGQRASGGESIRPRVPGIADQGGGLDAATNPQLVPGYHLAVLVTQTTA